MNYRISSKLKSLRPNSIIRNPLMCNVPLLLISKYVTKSLSRLSSSEPLGLQRNSLKNILDPMKSLPSLVLYRSLSIFQSPCALSMLEPATSNTFSERIQPASAPVIIDGQPEYEISQIVDSKIDHWWACKLLYKVIWLGYEDTGDESEWIPTSKLTHAANLVSNFHIAYSAKPSPLLLS